MAIWKQLEAALKRNYKEKQLAKSAAVALAKSVTPKAETVPVTTQPKPSVTPVTNTVATPLPTPKPLDRRSKLKAKKLNAVATELVLLVTQDLNEEEFDQYLKGMKK